MLTQTCVGSSPCNPQLIRLCLFWCVSFKSRNVKKKILGRLYQQKKGKQENNMYICYELYVFFDRSNYCRHKERENKNKSIQFISTGVLIFFIWLRISDEWHSFQEVEPPKMNEFFKIVFQDYLFKSVMCFFSKR